jgi:hypothetical protein
MKVNLMAVPDAEQLPGYRALVVELSWSVAPPGGRGSLVEQGL